MDHFNSNGVAIAYDDIGPKDGRSVVLVHGFASNRTENWRRLGWYGAFERKGYRAVALDLRGHGESAKPHEAEAYRREALLGDITGLMDHLGISRADVMGYSMGARLALALAIAHPERIDHLVLGGVGGRLFEPGREPGVMAAALTAEDPETISVPLLRSFRAFADEQGEDRLALAAFSEAPGEPFTRELVAAVGAPTLVVAGARDALAGDAEDLAMAIRGGRAVTLPGCDHFSAIPHALFKANVLDFLDDVMDF